MSLTLSYAAGLLSTLSPCVLPVLPTVAAGALRAHRFGPIAMAMGTVFSFSIIGFIVAATGSFLGLSPEILRMVGAGFLILFGLMLAIPWIESRTMAPLLRVISNSAGARISQIGSKGLLSQFTLGTVIGLVWAPCVGPTLGAALSLAAQGKDPSAAFSAMVVFGLGVVSPMLLAAYGLRSYMQRKRAEIGKFAPAAQRLFGFTLLLLGVGTIFGWDKALEAIALEHLPASWTQYIFAI